MGDTAVDFNAMHKNRLEKDLVELQQFIASHFEQRKKDDDELEKLKARIAQRKQDREDQLRIRQEREKRRLEEERELKLKREEEEHSVKKWLKATDLKIRELKRLYYIFVLSIF